MDLMETILGFTLRKYTRIPEEFLWRKVFNDGAFRQWVLDLIRQDQLFEKGEDGDGDVIGTYSEFTESINPEKVAGTHYTLFDTGDFYQSFILYVYKNYIEIDANPIKINHKGETENLFYKYGEEIIALNQANLDKLREQFLIRYREEIRQVLL
jgi:hypothetical protein